MGEQEVWRPLGVDTEEEIAEYDALHDGVPDWMASSLWKWVRESILYRTRDSYGDPRTTFKFQLVESLGNTLGIQLPDYTHPAVNYKGGDELADSAVAVIRRAQRPLQVVDYLLSVDRPATDLAELLERSRSVWTIGERAGKPGLVRRVPEGVQVAADSVMARAGQAGIRLAKAWEAIYGLAPNPSLAYGLAIKAVEDVAIQAVSPTNSKATLGTVLKQIEDQKNWRLPLDREHTDASSGTVLIGMMRLLWHGQHDRHGGDPSAPGNVSLEEATVAVTLAVSIVNLFASGLVSRAGQ